MSKLKDKFKISDFLKNSLVLINGTIIAQIINIIASPILSRLYGPEAFGKYSVIFSTVTILAILANLKYDLALMNPNDNDEERKATYYVSMILTSFFCIILLVLGIVVINLTPLFKNYTNFDIMILAVFIFFASNNSIVNFWLNKKGFYKQIAHNRVIYSIVYALFVILFGFLIPNYVGIILAVLIGYIVQFIYVYIFLYCKTEFNKYKFNKDLCIIQLKKHKNFPKFQMPSLLLNTSSTNLPVLLFSSLFGEIVSGWYSMTIKIINLPMTIVGKAVGEVYFKEASDLVKEKKYEKLSSFTYSTFKKLLFLGVIPMGLLIGYGDILFSFVLGKEWVNAGIYAMLLSPWYYMVFVTSPFTHLFVVLNKQKKNLYLNILMLISRVVTLFAGFYIFKGSRLATVGLFAIVGFGIWMFTNSYVLKMVNIDYKKSIRLTLLVYFGISLIISLPRILFYVF